MVNVTYPLPSVENVGTPEGREALRSRGLRPVLVAEGVFEELVDRVDWHEPDADGWYTPTLYRDTRDTDTVVDVPR